MKFREVPAGTVIRDGGNLWRKRSDNLGTELLSRDGSVSFTGGSRSFRGFDPEADVKLALVTYEDAPLGGIGSKPVYM